MKYLAMATILATAFIGVTPSAVKADGCTTNFKFGVCETVKGRNNGAANEARQAALEAAKK